MPTLIAEFVNQDAFNKRTDSVRAETIPSDRPGWHTAHSTGSVQIAPPMSGIRIPERAPSRILTLPDPAVGGYSEWQSAVGRTVDDGFSTHNRQPFHAQGHYDQVPTWNNALITGQGTPNTHGRYLRQGVLTQIAGYNPPSVAANIGYIAKLTAGSSMEGIGGNGLRL